MGIIGDIYIYIGLQLVGGTLLGSIAGFGFEFALVKDDDREDVESGVV